MAHLGPQLPWNPRLPSRCQPSLQSLQWSPGIWFHAYSCGCWPNSILCRLLDWGPQLLTGCWSKTVFGSCPKGLCNKVAFFCKVSSQEDKVKHVCASWPDTEVTVLHDWITAMSCHHSIRILFTRNKSLGPTHIQVGWVHMSVKTKRQGLPCWFSG